MKQNKWIPLGHGYERTHKNCQKENHLLACGHVVIANTNSCRSNCSHNQSSSTGVGASFDCYVCAFFRAHDRRQAVKATHIRDTQGWESCLDRLLQERLHSWTESQKKEILKQRTTMKLWLEKRNHTIFDREFEILRWEIGQLDYFPDIWVKCPEWCIFESWHHTKLGPTGVDVKALDYKIKKLEAAKPTGWALEAVCLELEEGRGGRRETWRRSRWASWKCTLRTLRQDLRLAHLQRQIYGRPGFHYDTTGF